jgi:nucleoside-diphosphate-sugar epimerase
MSRYLVTGASGFLGSHLTAQLVARGHEVVALHRRQTPTTEPRVTVRLGDVTDVSSIRDAASGCDGAFHCAGLVSRDPADAEAMYRVHVDGTKATMEALRRAGVARVVVASTSGTIAVSADKEAVADEETAAPVDLVSRWPYYRSKLYAERAALAANGNGLEVVCVNPSLLLGPGDLRGSSSDDVRRFLERKVPFIPAGGIAFVDARDAATALVLAMERGQEGTRYLVNAANMSLEAFFGRLERLSGVKAPTLRLPRTSALLAGVGADLLGRAARRIGVESPVDRLSAEMAQYFWYCDAGRAARELGWEARDPGDTLADTIADLRSRGVVWPAAD